MNLLLATFAMNYSANYASKKAKFKLVPAANNNSKKKNLIKFLRGCSIELSY
jgi:hypothetical protein